MKQWFVAFMRAAKAGESVHFQNLMVWLNRRIFCTGDIISWNILSIFDITNWAWFMISQIRFCDINKPNLWYHIINFVISQIQGDFYITKSTFSLWYHIIEIVMSINRICDLTKLSSFCNIKKSILWYQRNKIYDSKNTDFIIKWHIKASCIGGSIWKCIDDLQGK